MDKLQVMQLAAGALLKLKREESGKAQIDIANILGYRNYNYLSMIESGRTNIPAKRMSEIALAYGFSREDICVFVKHLQPELWEILLLIIESELGEEYSETFNVKVENKFVTILKNNNLDTFLQFI